MQRWRTHLLCKVLCKSLFFLWLCWLLGGGNFEFLSSLWHLYQFLLSAWSTLLKSHGVAGIFLIFPPISVLALGVRGCKGDLGPQSTPLTAVPSVLSVPLQWWSLFVSSYVLHAGKNRKIKKSKFETSEKFFFLLLGWPNGEFWRGEILPKEVLDSPSLQIFKPNWALHWAVCSSWPFSKQRGWTWTFQRCHLTTVILQIVHGTCTGSSSILELCISTLHTAQEFSVTEGRYGHARFQSATIKLINMKNQRQAMQDTQEN